LNSAVCLVRVFFMVLAPVLPGAGSPYHLNPWSEIRGPLQMTKGTLKKALGRNDADMEAAFTELFSAHRIETTTNTIRGKNYKAFKYRIPDEATGVSMGANGADYHQNVLLDSV